MIPDIHQLVSLIIIGGFVGLIAFSVVTLFHIERAKKSEFLHGLTTWGPFVPEAFLTSTGRKWALARNISALCFAGVGLIYAIVMALLQK